MQQSQIDRVKAFFSTRIDRYRAAYGRVSEDHPRSCVFIGSTIELEFLDPTGNRRSWPIVLDALVAVELIHRDCDQLWAEAVRLYRDGYQWWLPPQIERLAASRQDDFLEEDAAIETPLTNWLSDHPFGKRTGFTLYEVMTRALGKTDADTANKSLQARVTSALKRLGYRRGPLERNGVRRIYRWYM